MDSYKFKDLIASKALICFTRNIEQSDSYAEKGMFARLEKLGPLEEDGGVHFYVNFSGLEDINRHLESSHFSNEDGRS